MEDVKLRKPKMIPIRLLKGCCPASRYFVLMDGGQRVEVNAPINPEIGYTVGDKVKAGTIVELEADEARNIVKAGIGERADHVGW